MFLEVEIYCARFSTNTFSDVFFRANQLTVAKNICGAFFLLEANFFALKVYYNGSTKHGNLFQSFLFSMVIKSDTPEDAYFGVGYWNWPNLLWVYLDYALIEAQ